MFTKILSFFAASIIAIGNVFGSASPAVSQTPVAASVTLNASLSSGLAKASTTAATVKKHSTRALGDAEVLALAHNAFADGNVPLSDYRYVTDAPKKGYIYLCNVHKENPGSMVTGTWVHGDTWNFFEKVKVSGSISWNQATFSNTVSGGIRTLAGNDLPLDHATGIFPVASSDPAAKFDPNPSTISAQTMSVSLAAEPIYSDTPYCMGGEVGVMLSGVPLFNGFDAGLRDAAAHEVQDICDGHPQGSGEYHYHGMSGCLKDISVKTVLGYAYDGFPITGPEVASGKYLKTDDLDVCHGITSEIIIDGKKKTTYHYVMTRDFPYSASCFRAKPINTGPGVKQGQPGQARSQEPSERPIGQGQPPAEATAACNVKQNGDSCFFTTPQGDQITGICRTPPNAQLSCVPR